ncbi:MAG: tetratricopeptide repeat protein [Verrucomicrobiota bacterium]|nr:tetratricopeptide repeat protein [Verrucomicrobiota bacterium]
MRGFSVSLLSLVCIFSPALGQDDSEPDKTPPANRVEEPSQPEEVETTPVKAAQSVEELARLARRSAVVIRHGGRTGGEGGTGSGFVISEQGLIATCAHVIGESRPLTVHFDDGSEHKVTSIHAWDAKLDLAVLQIDCGDKTLMPIRLAEANSITQGAEVVAMGAPHGLEFSVVRGVLSALREFDGRALLQVAIPVEPGNSGGPLLDREGRVHGLLTMKSAVTDNLGFAVPVEALHRLLEKPNTVPMEKWLTIGKLDPKRWNTLMGSNWMQRAGRITVDNPGDGFGGRSLCLSLREVPEIPYEVAVEVLLDDEAGAAGLAFESDGADRHYGFYPSSGGLRLTRFDGPDVFTWNILQQLQSDAYQPGEWNRLRVRVEEKKITCFVNGEKVVELEDGNLRGGRVGLTKFRQTEATFRGFRLGPDLAKENAAPDLIARIEKQIGRLKRNPGNEKALEQLSQTPDVARPLLKREVESLRAQADALEEQSRAIHRRAIADEITRTLAGDEGDRVFRAGLLIARLDNTEIRVADYLEEVDRMASEIEARIPGQAGITEKVEAVATYLFKDNGFHGSRSDYYNRSNSYLNEVIDDREGIPITLSLLFVELARRVGADIHGLGLPGHFAACYEEDGKRVIIDPFEGGVTMSTEDADALLLNAGIEGTAAEMEVARPKEIATRMLRNLQSIAIEEKEFSDALSYVGIIMNLNPDSSQDRLNRALLNLQVGNTEQAKPDLQWILDNEPEGIHLGRIRDLFDRL